jgi:hypothetical protein
MLMPAVDMYLAVPLALLWSRSKAISGTSPALPPHAATPM